MEPGTMVGTFEASFVDVKNYLEDSYRVITDAEVYRNMDGTLKTQLGKGYEPNWIGIRHAFIQIISCLLRLVGAPFHIGQVPDIQVSDLDYIDHFLPVHQFDMVVMPVVFRRESCHKVHDGNIFCREG